jgi:hypothetical protein
MSKHILILFGVLVFFIFLSSTSESSELTFSFSNPSFSGTGQSSHYLTIENIERTRQASIDARRKADADKVISDAKNTAIAKFKANIEARFYTALAKQITDNVFGTDGLQQDSGTFTSPVGGEIVTWATPGGTGNVTVVVTETDGTVTTFTMPKQDDD